MNKLALLLVTLMAFATPKTYATPEACSIQNYLSQSPQQQEACTAIIKDLYSNYILGTGNFYAVARKMCTPKLLKYLSDHYEYDKEPGQDCFAMWMFRTGYQDGPGASKLLKIVPKSNGWFDVYYTDMGWNGKTSVRIIYVSGRPMFDEIIPDKSH